MTYHIGDGIDDVQITACIAIPSRRHIAVTQKSMVRQPGFTLLDASRPRRLVTDSGCTHSPHAMTKRAGMVKDCFPGLYVASSRSQIRQQHSSNKNQCCNDRFHIHPHIKNHIAIYFSSISLTSRKMATLLVEFPFSTIHDIVLRDDSALAAKVCFNFESGLLLELKSSICMVPIAAVQLSRMRSFNV
ncbi:MAG: hypothetical protein ABI144_01795 [Gallionella sp.]